MTTLDTSDLNSPSRPTPTQVELENAAQKTIDYLYKIKGDCSPELYEAIATLRQLINEEYLHKNKSVSSQFIYDVLKLKGVI